MIDHWLSRGKNGLICRPVGERCAPPRRGAHHDVRPITRPSVAGVGHDGPTGRSRGPTPTVDFKETFSQLDRQLGEQRHRASNFAPEITKRFQLAGGLGFEPRLTESESAVLPLNYPPLKCLS
jgi:hypothetical protein